MISMIGGSVKQMIFLFFLTAGISFAFAADNYPGRTINLDGGECVEVPYSADLNPAQFTVSFWAMVEDGTGTFRSPVTSRSSSTGYMFYAGDDDNWQFWCRNGTTTSMKITGPAVEMNKWTHIAGTYDGSKMTFYVDGSFAGEHWASSFAPNTQYPLRIGGGNTEGTPTYFFYGNIDEVSVWNYAKTADEVREGMYNTFSGSESGLVSYWQFNDETLKDSAGSNDGNSYSLEFPADLIKSDVVTGGGSSDHFILTEPASYEFVNTNVVINLISGAGSDSILVAMIDRKPDVTPGGYDAYYGYWVFRDYGTESYDNQVMFTFGTDLPDDYSGQNSKFHLFQRDIDSTGVWTYIGIPDILNTQDDYIIFNSLDLNSQYMITYDRLPEISATPLPYSYSLSGSFDVNGTNVVLAVSDIDNDGRADILAGKADGTISHFEADMFDPVKFDLITDNFSGIDVGENAAPAFTDIAQNGTLDLIIGAADGYLRKYTQNIYSLNEFKYSLCLEDVNFDSINVGKSSAPAFCDYDRDGLLDLFIGSSETGRFCLYKQISGTIFNVPIYGSMGSGSYQKPAIGDIDGDGLLDMLIGNDSGSFSHYEQTSPLSFFIFAENNFQGINTGSYSAPFLYDIDNNGLTDLLTGNGTGTAAQYGFTELCDIDFGQLFPGNLSSPEEVSLSGKFLFDNLYLTAPQGFSISFNDSTGFGNSLIISEVSGAVSDTVYVRFEPDTLKVYSGNLTVTSSEAQTYNINLIGEGYFASPSNVSIIYSETNATVSWDPVPEANSYRIFSSTDPYGTFSDISNFGTFDGNSWTLPWSGDKLFFYVIASTDTTTKVPVNKAISGGIK